LALRRVPSIGRRVSANSLLYSGQRRVPSTTSAPSAWCTRKGLHTKFDHLDEICEDDPGSETFRWRECPISLFSPQAIRCHANRGIERHLPFRRRDLPHLKRITVYGSSQYVARKGVGGLEGPQSGRPPAGFTWALESGDDVIVEKVKKGTTGSEQVEAGQMAKEAGIQLSEYVILGLGGVERTEAHALATSEAIDAIEPDFVRLRTLVPQRSIPFFCRDQ